MGKVDSIPEVEKIVVQNPVSLPLGKNSNSISTLKLLKRKVVLTKNIRVKSSNCPKTHRVRKRKESDTCKKPHLSSTKRDEPKNISKLIKSFEQNSMNLINITKLTNKI